MLRVNSNSLLAKTKQDHQPHVLLKSDPAFSETLPGKVAVHSLCDFLLFNSIV